MADPRFVRLHTDPRFRTPNKNRNKVTVDDRFKAIFEDQPGKNLSNSGRVDKYGRKISDSHEKDNLTRFYRLDTDNDKHPVPDQNENIQTPEIIDYARGHVSLESSDEDGGDSVKEDRESDLDDGQVVLGSHASQPIPVLPEEDQYLEIDLNEDEDTYKDLDAQAAAYVQEHAKDEEPEQSGTKTNRIAVVNLDWDHVRASHLYKIFSSLVSPTAPSASIAVNSNTTNTTSSANGNERDRASDAAKVIRGKVLSVRVYPSQFGKERMKREEVEGPPKELFKKSRRGGDALGSLLQVDEGEPFDEKALRRYQLERLRYYYAIVTCDTVEAATHIVSELDGAELEASANVFDLSFVPDDMVFDDEFRDEATSTTETANTTYKPLNFATDALRHSKLTLKWDEDDPEWNKITKRTLSRKEIDEGDFRAYIASSSSEDEDEGERGEKGKAERERLRKLLLSGDGTGDTNPFAEEDKGAAGDVEITFMPGLSEANEKTGEETTIEKYKRKQKEKRLARKKEKKEEAGMQKKGIDDDFFAAGSESESEGEEAPNVRKRSNPRKKQIDKELDEPAAKDRAATEAELELLIAPDDVSATHNHFDMKAILKAEKAKGKKRGKKNKKKKGIEDDDEVQEDFQIDVKDERFKALHEDYRFAIDPSNPHFKKTKSMAALLEERAKRQSGKETLPQNRPSGMSKDDGSGTAQSLQRLVESVKRKSSHVEGKGMGKRRKL